MHISAWTSKGLSYESINPPAKSDKSLAPSLNYINARSRAKFDGQCLKQDKITFTLEKVVNIYVVYEINLWSYRQGTDFTLGNFSVGAVKLIKTADFDKSKYSGGSIGYDACGSFSLSHGSELSKNEIIFGADMNSSVLVDNNKNNILILECRENIRTILQNNKKNSI